MTRLLIPLMSSIALMLATEVRAQQDSLVALRLEKIGGHKHLFILVGRTIQYKAGNANRFVSGRITGITDSTVSFQNKKLGDVTVRYKDIKALIVPRSVGRKVAGYIPLTMGSISLVAGLAFLSAINHEGGESQNISGFVSAIFLGAGALGILNGSILLHARRINLQKSWALRRDKIARR